MKKLIALLFALLATPVAAQTIPSGLFGSINYWGVGGLSQVLAPGLAGQCLQTQGVGSAPVWATCFTLPPQNANTILANVTTNFVAPQAVDVNRVLDTVGYDIARPPLVESIIYKSNVGPLFNWQALPPGVAGSVLTSGGPTNPPFWTTQVQANLAAICQTVGALLYFDTPSNLWKCLAPGTSGQLLQTGGASGNPSWLTVTLATLGGAPSTRNINTSAPLGGGGALSADLTLTCATCATTTNGGALSATSPVTISAGGLIACSTCLINGGALGTPSSGTLTNATGLPISTGVSGLGTGVAAALGVNVGAAGAFVTFNGAGGTPSAITLTNGTGLPLGTGVTGTLQAAQEPAHIGDMTNTAGSLATTVTGINGVNQNAAWTTYTPTATAQTPGATPPTFTSVTGRFKQLGKTVFLQATVAINVAGTGTGLLLVTLPLTAASNLYVGSSFESANTGKSGAAVILTTDTTRVGARDATSATYFANGNTVNFGITYEIP